MEITRGMKKEQTEEWKPFYGGLAILQIQPVAQEDLKPVLKREPTNLQFGDKMIALGTARRSENKNVQKSKKLQRSINRSARKPLQVSNNTPGRIHKRASLNNKPSYATDDVVVHRKKTFTCDMCQRHIGTKGGLKYHISAHLFGRPFKCDLCIKSFATKNDLTTHKKSHTERSICDFCKKKCTTKHNVAHHIASVHLEKQYFCFWCKRLYATKSLLNTHMHLVHPTQAFQKPPIKQEKFTCDVCKVVFGKKSYAKHVQMRAEMKYECSYCHQKFPCYDLYLKHRVAEEKSFDHKCPICKIHVVKSVYSHIRQKHGKFQCDICPFFCDDFSSIKQHKKLCGTDEHIKATKHKCSVCELNFRTRGLLLRHRINAHDCPFKCKKCPAQFLIKESLVRHSWRHNICKIRCLVCQTRLFETMEEFNSHFTKHLYKRGQLVCRLRCNLCTDYSFVRKSQLKDHIVKCLSLHLPTTTKKTPKTVCHVCDLCGKVLTLKKRAKAKANVNIMCSSCEDKFPSTLMECDAKCKCLECHDKQNSLLQWNAEEASILEKISPIDQLADFVERIFRTI